MSKEKLITVSQLKKSLIELSQDEVIGLISEISQSCPQAREFLTVKFTNTENTFELLQKYKNKVEHEFFPKRGFGRLNLKEAKKAVSDFRKICKDCTMAIDLMLFYVENSVEFTDQFGDISETFYNSASIVFQNAVKEINKGDIILYSNFADRLKWIVENACEDWGFKDELSDIYHELDYLPELED